MSPLPVLRRPRPGLLLGVVVTITVPSLLAALALSDSPLSAGVREDPSGHPVTAQAGPGMRMLGKSATAGLNASYQGVELIAQRGVAGPDTIVSDVWHKDGLTVTQTSNTTMVAGGQPYVSYDADNRSAEGVFGVTKTLVALLGEHYVAVYRGTGSAVGRPALIVELRRADGSLAARFWLDKQTMVPLRREVYDTSAELISQDAFVQVQFGALRPPPAAMAATKLPAGSAWAAVTAPAQLLTELNKQGWRLPGTLPGGLPLYAATRSHAGAAQVVQLGYSDGLSVVSLFVQRGALAAKPVGWQQNSLLGHQVYVAGHSIIWAAGGFVYTMIADAPPRVVTQVVAVLPRNAAPGVIGRIRHGLARLVAIINPFG
ncbi:MAG TPA: sigma-E factor regulatory protein RseB domain-containing protein [Trebonia sp.]|jgi:sigma-E factor negative regulatory protein RseB